jgi:hypothetical protein
MALTLTWFEVVVFLRAGTRAVINSPVNVEILQQHTVNGCHAICNIPDIFESVRLSVTLLVQACIDLTGDIFSTSFKRVR